MLAGSVSSMTTQYTAVMAAAASVRGKKPKNISAAFLISSVSGRSTSGICANSQTKKPTQTNMPTTAAAHIRVDGLPSFTMLNKTAVQPPKNSPSRAPGTRLCRQFCRHARL